MMQEFARQMERKQGRPARLFPDLRAGHIDLDFPMEAWIRAVRAREPRALDKLGMLTVAIKQLTAMSLSTLREAVSRTRALAYIEPVLRFVLHVPIRKRPVVRAEEYTRPIAMEEEVAKLVAVMIIAQTAQYINDRQWAYQRG